MELVMILSNLILETMSPRYQLERYALTCPNRIIEEVERKRLKSMVIKDACDMVSSLFLFQDDNVKALTGFQSTRKTICLAVIAVFKERIDKDDDNETYWQRIIDHGSTEEMKTTVIRSIPDSFMNTFIFSKLCSLSNLPITDDELKDRIVAVSRETVYVAPSIIESQIPYWFSFLSIVGTLFYRISVGAPIPFISANFIAFDDFVFGGSRKSKTSYDGALSIESGYVTLNPTEPLFLFHLSDLKDGVPVHMVPPRQLRSMLSFKDFSKRDRVIILTVEQASALGEFVMYGFKGKKKDRDLSYWNARGITPQYCFDKVDAIHGMEFSDSQKSQNAGGSFDKNPKGDLLYGGRRMFYLHQGKNLGEAGLTADFQQGIIPDEFVVVWSSSDFKHSILSSVRFKKDLEFDSSEASKYADYMADFFDWETAQEFISRPYNSIDIDVLDSVITYSDAIKDAINHRVGARILTLEGDVI